jgi:hypothetical protein
MQTQVCLDTKNVNAKACGHCGGFFMPKRSTARFCSSSCRVAAFNATARANTRAFKSERRSAISIGFDGRLQGSLRPAGRTRQRVRGLSNWVTRFGQETWGYE